MNFNEWRNKYYPDLTNEDTIHKMSHAYASGHVNMDSNSVPREQYDRVVGLLEKIKDHIHFPCLIHLSTQDYKTWKKEVEMLKDEKNNNDC